MKNNWSSLMVIFTIALVAFLVLAVLFGGWGMMGPWMMGPGMMWGFGPLSSVSMLLGLLIPPLVVIILIVLFLFAVIGLTRLVHAPTIGQTCPSCGQAVKSDWTYCPHCNGTLK